jgi:choloylglycine hydrolase
MAIIVTSRPQPSSIPHTKDERIYKTEYRTLIDLTDKISFFELSRLPNVIWTDLNQIDCSKGSGVRTLDPDALGLSGDVTDRFVSAELAF